MSNSFTHGGEPSVCVSHPKVESSFDLASVSTGVRDNVEWVDDVNALALRVRKDPVVARELTLLHLVRNLSQRWRIVHDLQVVSDEAPVTAWIIRRKSDVVLPQKEPEAESNSSLDKNTREEDFLREAVHTLHDLWSLGQEIYSRPVSVQSERRYRPIKGADLGKLARSWPKLRVRTRAVAPRVIKAESDPLDAKIAQIMNRLSEYGCPLSFDTTIEDKSPQSISTTFLAMIHLWHYKTVELNQENPYDTIWITLQTPSTGDDK